MLALEGVILENDARPRPLRRGFVAALLSVAMAGCTSLGAPGPSTASVKRVDGQAYAAASITLVDLDDQVTARVSAYSDSRGFSELLGDAAPMGTIIGRGDVIDIAIWEAPPAVLFGVTSVDARLAANPLVAQSASIPQQMVGDDGHVTVPFVGTIAVAGRSTVQVERQIVRRLAGKAHGPQAVVRLVQNEARNVTVIGEVANSRRVPLSARGERLLDVLAAAGGSKQPVGKTTVQISRGATAAVMPLEAVIRDSTQNIRLRPDDVVTVLFQPYSFTALGAVAQNAEVPFEGSGLTLAQALGRIGGLRDDRADVKGVFIFRMEDPSALDPAVATSARKTLDGKIPVIYRLDLSSASSFFVAQNFMIRDDDILYVSNAPGVDFQKFLSTLSNLAFSTIAIGNAVN